MVVYWSSGKNASLNCLKSWWKRKHLSTGEQTLTPMLSIEWVPVHSLLFYFSFYHHLFTFFAFFISRLLFRLQSRVSTVIPVIPPSPGDSNQINIASSKVQPSGRQESTVKARFMGNQSIHRWCDFSTAITVWGQDLLQNDRLKQKRLSVASVLTFSNVARRNILAGMYLLPSRQL